LRGLKTSIAATGAGAARMTATTVGTSRAVCLVIGISFPSPPGILSRLTFHFQPACGADRHFRMMLA
jgi:hypothetical protein